MATEKVFEWLRSRGQGGDRLFLQEEETRLVDLRTNAIKETADITFEGGSDIEQFKKFFINAMPFVHPNLFPDYLGHILATSIGARLLAEKISPEGLTPSEAELKGLTHDLSSLIVPQHYLRKNLLQKHFATKLGLESKSWNENDIVSRILNLKKPRIDNISDITIPETIEDMADNLCKTTSDGQLKTWETTFKGMADEERIAVYSKDVLWPSTVWGVHQLYEPEQIKSQVAIDLFGKEIELFKSDFGINFEDLRNEIQEELNSPSNQDFLIEGRNNQETLDREVDKKLGRNPVNKVVFDIGGVLIDVNDDELTQGLAQRLKTSKEKILESFDKLNSSAMSGEISEEEYYKKFSEMTGVILPNDIASCRVLFEMPEIYKVMPGMQEIVSKLSRGNSELFIYSNIIPAVGPLVKRLIAQFYPELPIENILFSYEIKANKKNPESFNKLADILEVHEGKDKVLFIDDMERYTTNARTKGLRGFTFKGNPYRNISPQQRLNKELAKANLYN
jgi:FMN phosphatase YigB (HAD superfamily)